MDRIENGGREASFLTDLQRTMTIEKYRKIFGRIYWDSTRRAIRLLGEQEAGIQGIAYLLKLTEIYRNELSEEEIKNNKHKLWSFHLELLDKSDRWEEYIETLEKYKQEPEGKNFQPAHWVRLTPGGRKDLDSAASHYAWWRAAEALWENDDPRAAALFVSRQSVIQRKIDRRKTGKSFKHLRHKEFKELTDEQYQYRIEVIKYWFGEAKKWEDWRKKRNQEK